MPNLEIESQFSGLIGGVDEVGRGPWAGPVVAAAAVFLGEVPGTLNDSKKLTQAKRESLFEMLMNLKDFRYGIGVGSVEEIDRMNILQATFLAMERAVKALPELPPTLLIDGKFVPKFSGSKSIPVIGGDGKSLTIAAASIIAKVTRDRMMVELAKEYPAYGWERNAGYGTAEHQAALKMYGVTVHHRRSFAPIRERLQPSVSSSLL